MPGRDGTGPQGKGPKTGGLLGECVKAVGDTFRGRGMGRGHGWGRGAQAGGMRDGLGRGMGRGMGSRRNWTHAGL